MLVVSSEELIGKTPLLEAKRVEKDLSLKARLLLKLERFSLAGSVKDRAALFMLEGAEKAGKLSEGGTVIVPTSGNTGIALACIAALKGYRAVVVMPDSMSAERTKLVRAYGAEVVHTSGSLGMKGAIEKAEEIVKKREGVLLEQFSDPANVEAHFRTTGPEIWEDAGKVDCFVAGVGTGGTIAGVAKFLKSKNSKVKIVAVEPADSPVLSGGKAGAHRLQGIGAGFVPDLFDPSLVDEIFPVKTDEAYSAARMLARTEGVLAGISSGAALFAAISMCSREEFSGKNVVALLPDTGERYLSTELFE